MSPLSWGGISILARWADVKGVNLADVSEDRRLNLRDQAERLFDEYFGEPSKASLLRVALWLYDEAACRLKHYEWAVVHMDEDLLLADAPVVAIAHQGPDWKGLLPHGCSIFLPLAPRQLLVGTSPLFIQPQYGVRTQPRIINRLAVRDAHSTVFRHPATVWPHSLSLAPKRAGLVSQGWSVSRGPDEELSSQESSSELGLPALADPTAQQLMETLQRHEVAKVERVAERMTNEIMQRLSTGEVGGGYLFHGSQ